MWSRFAGLLTAAAATLLVVGMGAAVVGPLLYFLLVFVEGLLETVGLIVRGWGAAHGDVLVWIAAGLVGAAALWAAWCHFHGALQVEAELRRGGEPPPG